MAMISAIFYVWVFVILSVICNNILWCPLIPVLFVILHANSDILSGRVLQRQLHDPDFDLRHFSFLFVGQEGGS